MPLQDAALLAPPLPTIRHGLSPRPRPACFPSMVPLHLVCRRFRYRDGARAHSPLDVCRLCHTIRHQQAVRGGAPLLKGRYAQLHPHAPAAACAGRAGRCGIRGASAGRRPPRASWPRARGTAHAPRTAPLQSSPSARQDVWAGAQAAGQWIMKCWQGCES